MSYVVDVGYALDLSQIGAAINKFKELQKEVDKTDKALNSMGKAGGSSSEAKRTKEMKDLGSAAEVTSKKVKRIGESATQAGDKFDRLAERNKIALNFMTQGFTKGEATILATAKQAGALDKQIEAIGKSMIDIGRLTSNAFDNSQGSVRALEKELQTLKDRIELNAKGLNANAKQLREYSRAAEEVRATIKTMGVELNSTEGQKLYNKLLTERRQKLESLIKTSSELEAAEKKRQDQLKQAVQPRTSQQSKSDIYLSEIKVIEDVKRAVAAKEKAERTSYEKTMVSMRSYYTGLEQEDAKARQQQQKSSDDLRKNFLKEQESNRKEYQKTMSDMAAMYRQMEKEVARSSGSTGASSPYERQLLVNKAINEELKAGVPYAVAKLKAEERVARTYQESNAALKEQIAIQKQITAESRKVQGVERRANVRQTSKELGVNLQDAAFILDAKATGNMQLYNKALESTRKTMLETIPVATTLKTLIPAIGAVGSFAFLAQATREFLKMADSMRLVEARINLVSTAGADASQVLDQLVEISKENRVNLDTTSRLYTRLVPAMESFKVNLEGAASATDAALKVTKAFGAALLISGANTQEAIAATTQFTQAMASGKLAGDEFRSVSEAAPAFLKAIADGSGYARSELKALASEGKLTTELISQALLKMQSSLEAKAAKVPVTMGQAFERVKTDLMVFSRDLNESTGAVDGVVSAIEGLGIVIQGAGEVLGFLRSVVDGINGPLNTLGTSFGQVVIAIGAVITISKLLTGIMGAAGIAGAATTAGGALVTATAAIRGYTAATAISVAATGTLSTALFAARGAVLALGAALASTPIGVILAGAATAAGVLYFNSEQAAVQISKLAEEKEGSIKSTKVLLESEEKLAKSWDELKKKAPEVGQAIQKSFDSSGVKSLTDDQQRELEEAMKRIQKLREDVSKDNLSGRERVEKNELIIALKKEYDARYRTFVLQQQIDMFNGTSDGAASDMIKKLQDEVKQREQVNKLLREGVSLRKAEMIAAGMAAIQQQYGTPTIMPGEGPIQFEARKLSIKRQIAEQEAIISGYVERITTLDEERAAILDSQKGAVKEKTNSLLEELQALEKLLPLAKQIGDVEKARLVLGGMSVEKAQRLLDLRKKLQDLENTKSREEETEAVQKELELLKQGLTVEQVKAILEQDALKRAMIAKGYSEDQIKNRIKEEAQIKALTEADKERQEAAQKLQETYAEFITPEKLEIGDLFGDAAQGAGVLLNTMYDIAAQQEEIAKRKELINKSGIKGQALEKELMAIQKKQSANELANMRAVAGGAKQLFKEKSTGYKVLERLEQAMFVMQLYNQKAEIAAFLTGVATKVAGYATTALAAGKAAIASAMIAPPPANFASLAAVLAVLAGIGLAVSGARGGGSDSAPVYNEGKGTVLGDPNAQSESIKKSIEALEQYAKTELPITSAMLKSLRNIESNIRGLASLLIRQAPGSELIEGVQQGTVQNITTGNLFTKPLGVFGSGLQFFTDHVIEMVEKITLGFIPIRGIFDSILGGVFGKVSTKVIGSGLTANLQTMKEVMENGFELLEFVDVQIKKKSWFSSSSKVVTQTAQADEELSRQFSLIFENFYSTILLAAKPLGANLDVVAKLLDNFVIDIGKIQLGGKTGSEVQEALEAVFGQQADLMARFAFSTQESIRFVLNEWIWFADQWYQYGQQFTFDEFLALPEEIQAKLKPVVESLSTPFDDFQRVGEGYFETITRVASSIERARFAADTFRVEMVALSDVVNKQGDVAVELLRQSLIKAEKDTYGFATGVSEIVAIFDGSIDDLEEMWKALTDVRQNLRAAGKSFEDLSSSMIAGARGFEQLQNGLDEYFENFLSEQERYDEILRQMTEEFTYLNLAVPQTIEEFKTLVQGIDTTAESGQQLFGALISLSPAFSAFMDSMDELKESEQAIKGVEQNLRAAGKAFEGLSASMIAGAGGSERLQNGLETFFETFLSEGDRFDELMRQMVEEFSALRVIIPQTKEQFRALVQGIDTTTESGQQLFGALVALAPEFDKLASLSAQMIKNAEAEVVAAYEREMAALDEVIKARDTATSNLKEAYDREMAALDEIIKARDDAVSELESAYDREMDALDKIIEARDNATSNLKEAYDREIAALDETIKARDDAVSDLKEAYDREIDAIDAVIKARDDAVSDLKEAYDREIDAIDAVIKARDDAISDLKEAYDREIAALDEVIKARDDAISDLKEAYDREMAALDEIIKARDDAISNLKEAYDREIAVLDDVIKARDDAISELESAYDREIAALDEVIKARDDAISELKEAYDAESSAIEKTISSLKGLADGLRDFIKSVNQSIIEDSVVNNQTSFAAFRQALSRVNGGDEKALEDALAIGDTLRSSIPETATSSVEMMIRLAELREEAKSTLGVMESQVSVEELQLEQLKESVETLLGLDEGVKTVAEALAQLEKAEEAAQAAEAQKAILTSQLEALGIINQTTLSVTEAISKLEKAEETAQAAEAQKAVLTDQLTALGLLNQSTLSVTEAISRLEKAEEAAQAAEAQKTVLTEQLTALGVLNGTTLSVAEAIAQLEKAEIAAQVAEAQKTILTDQLTALGLLNQTTLSVTEAISKLEKAEEAAQAAEAQKTILTDQLTALGVINQSTLSVAEAIAQLEKAGEAAQIAEAQKTVLTEQLTALGVLNGTTLSVTEAITQLEKAEEAAQAAEAQKAVLTDQLTALGVINEATLSVAEAIAQLEKAEEAAQAAEAQKAILTGQMEALGLLNQSTLSVAGAIAQLEKAQEAAQAAEAQKTILTGQLEALGIINQSTLSVTEALSRLEKAEEAAQAAEAQKTILTEQLEALGLINQSVLSLAGAVANLAEIQGQVNSQVQQQVRKYAEEMIKNVLESADRGVVVDTRPVDPTSLTGVEAAINGLYQEILGRSADVGGLKSWADSGMSLSDIRTSLSASLEAAARDAGYQDFFYGLVKQGIASVDAANRVNGTTPGAGVVVPTTLVDPNSLTGLEAAINRLYQELLGRSADAAGLAYWIESGMSLADIRASIAASEEASGASSVSPANRFATGGVFTNSVVSSPTMFSMGLMGEAGPEAIMPLARGADGSLGVRSMVDSGVARGLEILAAKLETLINDNRAAQSAIATNTGKVARIIERADNGDSINVALVAD